MWLIIIGVLIAIGLFAIANEKSQEVEVEKAKYVVEETKAHVNKRIRAYADYLRRTSSDEIRAMSDNELHDMIERAMEEFEKDYSRSTWLSNGLFAFGVLVAVIALSKGDDTAPPIIAGIIGFSIYLRKRSRKKVYDKYIGNGWEPERLKL